MKILASALLLSCSPLLLSCSLWAETEEYRAFESEIPEIQVPATHLSSLIARYVEDPNCTLSNDDILDLTNYAAFPDVKYYDTLSPADRKNLTQLILLNRNLFDPQVLVTFQMTQKKMAGMTVEQIQSLESLTSAIKLGHALSPEQILDLKHYETFFSKTPYAYLLDLFFLTPYVAQNPSFSPSEVDAFRKASREACGISETDFLLFQYLAKEESPSLSNEQIASLNTLALKAPIGSLKALSPDLLNKLTTLFQKNSSSFSSEALSRFNTYK